MNDNKCFAILVNNGFIDKTKLFFQLLFLYLEVVKSSLIYVYSKHLSVSLKLKPQRILLLVQEVKASRTSDVMQSPFCLNISSFSDVTLSWSWIHYVYWALFWRLSFSGYTLKLDKLNYVHCSSASERRNSSISWPRMENEVWVMERWPVIFTPDQIF